MTEEFKPCPWCNKQPKWLYKRMDFGTGASGMEAPMRALGCANDLCPVQPKTEWMDTQRWSHDRGYFAISYDKEAIAAWNSRYNV